ncbi:penicillin-binding transpeptidase domain-containing protein [Mycobacterium tuberculosis]|uniref:penicillin-binding transpeptidase domain-containing protein n=1 Tax=Mycobacterium tuberculosis TaxID=1773 RepID=UPI00272A5D51|nr:penicillin-binding transpeptidase domain-containing protein [Mycobacterium tuberculosis]
MFVEGIDQESWQALNESIDKPLLNRALRGTYPPGSTYKPFMALAALETGKRSASTVIQDGGSWLFGGHVFRQPVRAAPRRPGGAGPEQRRDPGLREQATFDPNMFVPS